jgi:hypothetical protein
VNPQMVATGSIYVVDTARSYIKVKTTSSVHDIHGKGTGITGEMSALFHDGTLDRDIPVNVKIAIPVEKLSSGNRAQDEKMHGLISSRAYPNIEAILTHATTGSGPHTYKVSGSIVINGMSRLFGGEATIDEKDGHVEITGQREFDIRLWRIEAPKFLGFGVNPTVMVELKLYADLKAA